MSVAAQLAALDQLVNALSDERDRLNSERSKLLGGRMAAIAAFPPLALFDVGAIQTRADSMLALLAAIDAHMVDTLPTLEARARAGDAGAAERALTSTTRILEAVGGVSPVNDLIDDSAKLVRDIANDAKSTGLGIGAAMAIAGVAFVALKLFL